MVEQIYEPCKRSTWAYHHTKRRTFIKNWAFDGRYTQYVWKTIAHFESSMLYVKKCNRKRGRSKCIGSQTYFAICRRGLKTGAYKSLHIQMTGLDSGAVRRSFFEQVFPLSIFSLPVAFFLSSNTYAPKIQLKTKNVIT